MFDHFRWDLKRPDTGVSWLRGLVVPLHRALCELMCGTLLQWDLVCSEAYKCSAVQSVFMAGEFEDLGMWALSGRGAFLRGGGGGRPT